MWWSFWCEEFPSQVGVWSVLRKEWMWEKHLTWWCRDSMRMLQLLKLSTSQLTNPPRRLFFFPPILVQTDLKVFGYPNPRLWSSGAQDGLNVTAAGMDHSSQPLTRHFGAEISIFHSLVWILGSSSLPESWQSFPKLPAPSGAPREWLCWSWREKIPSKPSFSCCSDRGGNDRLWSREKAPLRSALTRKFVHPEALLGELLIFKSCGNKGMTQKSGDNENKLISSCTEHKRKQGRVSATRQEKSLF